MISFDVRKRLERIADSGALPGSNRNLMVTPFDASVILAALASRQEIEEALSGVLDLVERHYPNPARHGQINRGRAVLACRDGDAAILPSPEQHS
jgi:hypothetical protein